MLPPSPRRSLPLLPRLSLHVVALCTGLALHTMAAAQISHFEPRVGQEGKDVVWVPTPDALVQRMLDLGQVKPGDYVIDLGAGDGRTVIAAAKRGARAHGIEYHPEMVALARKAAKEANVAELATFEQGDLFESDLSKASVITLFLLPSINERLSPKLLNLAPGTRIVSNSFRMGDWEPDDVSVVSRDCTRWCSALLWVVPAPVAGNWTLNGQHLQLQQNYQKLEGTLGQQAISQATLQGNQIAFHVGHRRYVGTVDNGIMRGKIEGSGRSWQASR